MGAELLGGGTDFRVWAPRSRTAAVLLWSGSQEKRLELVPERDGYFSGFCEGVQAGMRYKIKLDGGAYPDPASRYQPEGPHGPSEVVDPDHFSWTDGNWKGVERDGQIIYEMHVGTFTKEGTWRAALDILPELAKLGITILEIMPVAEFPGRFGWGYDGVDLFAPTRLYGEPDDFRQFVDRAHSTGLGVILDVVYNHFGPDGCYLREFSEDYFSKCYKNEWGDPINFDGDNSAAVREFFTANAGYWIDEFHLDGLRLDATQQIFDCSNENIMAVVAQRVREAGKGRGTYLVAENEPQEVKLVKSPEDGGYGMDSLWNDDFHHSAMVVLTGRNEAYYSDYLGSGQEFISMLKYGYLYQGQRYKWQKNRRGTASLDLHPNHFVNFLQNHDQVANSLTGKRIHDLTSPAMLRTMTALLLLGPNTPMLFQGQEFSASAPFLYFADHSPELARQVAAGRRTFLEQFSSVALLGDEVEKLVAVPDDEQTFLRCKLDHAGDRSRNSGIYRLHADLLALRRKDPVLRQPRKKGLDGAVLDPCTFVLRFFGEAGDDRLLLLNLGVDLHLDPAPEPLLAPVSGSVWETLWSSESPQYGGTGASATDTEENWHVPGHSATLFRPAFPK